LQQRLQHRIVLLHLPKPPFPFRKVSLLNSQTKPGARSPKLFFSHRISDITLVAKMFRKTPIQDWLSMHNTSTDTSRDSQKQHPALQAAAEAAQSGQKPEPIGFEFSTPKSPPRPSKKTIAAPLRNAQICNLSALQTSKPWIYQASGYNQISPEKKDRVQ
jgi:hypothetical protein